MLAPEISSQRSHLLKEKYQHNMCKIRYAVRRYAVPASFPRVIIAREQYKCKIFKII